MKKTWENAVVEELVIEATAGGGNSETKHDAVYAEFDGKLWEGYYPESQV